MPSASNQSRQIRKRLIPVRNALIRSDLVILGWKLYTLLMIGFLTAILGEEIFYWSATIRFRIWLLGFAFGILLIIFIAGSALAIFRDRFPRYRWEHLARFWGSKIFDRQDTVLNALQLEQRQSSSEAPGLSRAYIHEVDVQLAHADSDLVQDRKGQQRWKFRAALSVVVTTIILITNWQSSGAAVFRWIHPRVNYKAPAPFTLSNITEDIHVLGGDPVDLAFQLVGEYPDSVILELKSLTNDIDDSLSRDIRLSTQPGRAGSVRFQLTDIYRDYQYRAVVPAKHFWEAWDEVATPFHMIQVTDRPSIESLTFTIIPPLYSRLSPESQEGNRASIQGLKGSRVAVQLESNRTLASAELRFRSIVEKMNVRGRRANGEFTLVTPDTVTILLKDRRKITNADPIPYIIDILPDQFPRIKVRSPESQFDLGDNLLIPLELDLEDDFGFSDLQLVYAIHHPSLPELEPATSIFSLTGLEPDRTTQLLRSIWDVNALSLMPEDELHFHFELFDNDIISGPKKTVSGEFVARLPSLADLFETLESQEEDLTQGLDERLEEVRSLREQLQKVELDLVKTEAVDWEQKQAIKKQLERFKKEAEALQEMAEALEKMAELDEKQNLFSDELRKKFDELQDLVSQLINDELMNKLNQLDQNLDLLKLDDLKKAMTELAQNADRIEADLDRFLDLFRRVQAEQKMDEISRRLEALVKEQSTLDKKIQQTPEDVDPSDRARLNEDERRIRNEWEQTLTSMEEGAEQVREFSPETAADLEEMRNSDTAQQAGDNLQSTMNQLSDSQMTQASRSSSQALQNLSDLSRQARQLQTRFQNQTANAMAGKFRSLMRDLLSLSKSQESLLNTTQSTAAHSSRFRDLAAREQVLKDQLLQTMSKLMELSRETFAVTPEMGKALGQAAVQMEGAKQALSERNRNAAMKGQESAMASLNSGARALGSAARQMQQSGSASGFEQFLAQMQSMAGQQQSLNQQGLPLLMGQSGAALRQQLMQRMLAGQQGIRKSLQQLMEEMRSSGNPQTGDMGGMARGMDEVIRDLQAGRYTRKTRARQEQILSRMLDSQKSLTQRGKKEERKSRTAAQVSSTGPGGLPIDLGQRQSEVLEALNDALQAGYPADYQVMIRRYFNSLNSQSLPASESTGDSSP